jgi:molecular chaperone GrpE
MNQILGRKNMTRKTEKTDEHRSAEPHAHHKHTAKQEGKQDGKQEPEVPAATTAPEPEPEPVAQAEPEPVEETAEQKLAQMQDKYLRLSAEFDNYRKRTLREKMDLIKTAGDEILVDILPVLDDFERAMIAMKDSIDPTAIRQGIDLIYNKFRDFLTSQGVKEIEALGQELNTDFHDAVSKIPAPEESLKGKIVDVIQKGYILHEKVIRHSKVVIGE